MSQRDFLDTNILVYADDLDAGPKNHIAQRLVKEALTSVTGVISTQVLQEFFVITTRKLGVPADIARRKVELLSRLQTILIRPELILGAIDLHRLHKISFWDALVIKCAATAGCARLLTEDLQHGQRIEDLRICNPFVESG